jgi:hypothetical protein
VAFIRVEVCGGVSGLLPRWPATTGRAGACQGRWGLSGQVDGCMPSCAGGSLGLLHRAPDALKGFAHWAIYCSEDLGVCAGPAADGRRPVRATPTPLAGPSSPRGGSARGRLRLH